MLPYDPMIVRLAVPTIRLRVCAIAASSCQDGGSSALGRPQQFPHQALVAEYQFKTSIEIRLD